MIRIITDSTADFQPKDAKELNVCIIPLQVHFGEEHFSDGIDLTLEEFYEKLSTSSKLPTTSQPSPELFMKEFEAAKAVGDTVIGIFLSSTFSGTLQSAQIAKEEVDYENIYIVDSKNATLAAQLLVRRAVIRVQQGFSASEIVADLEQAREHLHLFAMVDTLKYLHKGGRLSAAVALAGSLLGIKPVLLVKDGKISIADKARGLPGAYVAIFKQIDKVGGIDESFPVLAGYTGTAQGVEPFTQYVTQNLKLSQPLLCPIGTVIGTHAGPGARGIAFFSQPMED